MQNGTLIILQGIPFCNIDCSYCYLPNRSDTTRMPLHVARAVFRRVFESRRITEPITFLWHAGEPLALPASVYAELFDIAHSENRRYQKKFTFSIQTNGTLIDNRWIELFRRHQVQIGVSVDGPAFIHDFNRRDRSGRPTHARTMAGVKLLQEAGLKTPVITVLSDHSLDYPDQMFEFFEANDLLKIGLNVEATTGTNCSSTVESYQRVVAFFQRFIERVSKSDKTFEVRELGLAYGTFRTLDATIDPPSGRSSTSEPFDIITIDRQGDYSTFCPELRGADAPRYFNFKMGNVLHDAFDGMVDNPVFKLVDQEIKHGLSRCHDSCPYWFTCFGGTPSSKFFETGRFDAAETENCRYQRQAVVDALTNFVAHECEPARARG